MCILQVVINIFLQFFKHSSLPITEESLDDLSEIVGPELAATMDHQGALLNSSGTPGSGRTNNNGSNRGNLTALQVWPFKLFILPLMLLLIK